MLVFLGIRLNRSQMLQVSIFLMFSVSMPLYAEKQAIKMFNINSLPEGYREACTTYKELMDKELTVKAEKHLKGYAKEFLKERFWLPKGVKRKYRITSPIGWIPSLYHESLIIQEVLKSDLNEDSGDSEGKIGEKSVIALPRYSENKFNIPEGTLEKWQDIIHENFSGGYFDSIKNSTRRVFELTLLADNSKHALLGEDTYVINICKDDLGQIRYDQLYFSKGYVEWTVIDYQILKIKSAPLLNPQSPR